MVQPQNNYKMKQQFDTIAGVSFWLNDHGNITENTKQDTYEQIRDGLKQPTYTRRIGDEMKIAETEIEGIDKIYTITEIITIDYLKYQLESRLKPTIVKTDD